MRVKYKSIKTCSACCYELLYSGRTLPSYVKSKFIGHYFTAQQTTVNIFNSANGKSLFFLCPPILLMILIQLTHNNCLN